MVFLNLFIEFFKTGLFAVGGGLATLPFLYDIANNYPWFTKAELVDMIAVSESTPGPIGVNMATYAGFSSAGIMGALTASMALILPSLVIILIVSSFLNKFKENKLVEYSFSALRPAVAGLISAAALELIKVSLLTLDLFDKTKNITDLINIKAVIFFLLIFYGIKKFKFHPIVYILISGVIGIFLNF